MMSRIGLMVASTILSGSVFAAPITGRLVMNGLTLVGSSLTTIDFNYPGCGSTTPICAAPPASSSTTGTFQVGTGSTLSFAPFIGVNGSVHSFDISIAPPDALLTPGMTNFVLIPSLSPQISFTLREVYAGSFGSADCTAAAAPGQTCTPILSPGPPAVKSPLELSNTRGTAGVGDLTGLSSHAQFSVLVDAINTGTGEKSQGTGTFSTDFAGYSFQTLLNAAKNGNVITTGFAGDFTIVFTAVPEPSGLALGVCGAALLGLSGLVGRVRNARKAA